MSAPALDPRTEAFYARTVGEVARDLVGCVVRHGTTAGRIVETESYHQSEGACHAHTGETERTRPLFGRPGTAYVYRSYGVHALLNAVAEPEGVGAAALIRALEPLEGLTEMRARRGLERPLDLCSGPGKLTQALGVLLTLNRTRLAGPDAGPIEILPPSAHAPAPRVVTGRRIGITRAVELEWRFCDADSAYVSRPLPPAMRPTSRTRRAPRAPRRASRISSR